MGPQNVWFILIHAQTRMIAMTAQYGPVFYSSRWQSVVYKLRANKMAIMHKRSHGPEARVLSPRSTTCQMIFSRYLPRTDTLQLDMHIIIH